MSKYSASELTTEGLRLASLAANGKTSFTITRVASTADDLTDADVKTMSRLPNEVQTGTLVDQVKSPDGSNAITGAEVRFDNMGLKDSYNISAVALFATEMGTDKPEVLYSITKAIEPEFIPDFADKVLLQFGMTIYVIVGEVSQVDVHVDPTGLATKDYVDDAIEAVDVSGQLVNYQTPAITASTGDVKSSVSSSGDLTAAILTLPRGINSIFVNAKAANNPAKVSLHGMIHIFNVSGAVVVGKGMLFDASGNAWIVVANGSVVTYTKLIKDNGDGSVTYGDNITINPADKNHTQQIRENGTSEPANFDSGDLTIDKDLEVLGVKVFDESEDYATFAATHPNALIVVTKDKSEVAE